MEKQATFIPYVPTDSKMKEISFRAIVLGIILGFFFAVGNTYLGLRLGATISASIPAAVLSMGILRFFGRNVSILENNIVQTMASVGEAIAGGVIFTIPALFLLGEKISVINIAILSALGGLLGILFMIPMRRYIIVKEHGKLPFPEGKACAEILKAGHTKGASAMVAVWGIVVGAVHKFCSSGLNVWPEVSQWTLNFYQRTAFSIDCTPALLGVGYIIGPRISFIMLSGGVLAWGMIIPLIMMFGQTSGAIYPSTVPIAQMSANDVWNFYVRYIGAGTVAVGGIYSLVHIFPLVFKTLKEGLKEILAIHKPAGYIPRTDLDISLKWLALGAVAIILMLWLYPGFPMNFTTIMLLVILGFFFVGVTSLTVGVVGSTSNPGSGMTLTVLLATCLIFVALGWTERLYLISAMMMGSVASIAISLAATTSQDLKTGFLLGATPRNQQIAEIIGIIVPALTIGGTLYLLDSVYGFGSNALPAPQAILMSLVVKGVISGELPLILVGVGVMIGVVLIFLRVPILPFALGVYLPLSLTTGTALGGVVAFVLKKMGKQQEGQDRGVLISSGLVAGEACVGVFIALMTLMKWLDPNKPFILGPFTSVSIYIIMAVLLGYFSIWHRKTRSKKKHPR
ncbi:MAG: oligopeptide transporter, OPT family [Parachlamydiales bacterium]|nr:oligopeptide transporter, OPT family [Parachlamydiales bacterium]